MAWIPTRSVRIIHIVCQPHVNFLLIVVFLERLESYDQLPAQHINHLGDLYRLSKTTNAELRLRFYQVALKDPTSSGAKAFASEAINWVVGDDGTGIIKGRMKFCRPIFRAVSKVDKDLAVRVFVKAKDEFHPIARKLIEKVIRCTPFIDSPLLCSNTIQTGPWVNSLNFMG